MRAQHLPLLATGILTVTALTLAGCSTATTPDASDATQQSASATSSAPASSSAGNSATPSTSSTATAESSSAAASADASTVAWAGGVQVVPSSGPVKLPAPKTQDAAMEVVFQMVQRYNHDQFNIESHQSTDVGPVEPYVTGQPLAQLKQDVKAYQKVKLSGSPRIERIMEPKDSWASTGEVTTKEGKKVRTKYSSVRLQVCLDNSDVKLVEAPKGTVTNKEKRRIFSADAFYYPTQHVWFLTSYKEADGNPTC